MRITKVGNDRSGQRDVEHQTPVLSLLGLGWVFLKIGLTAFGGLGAALALIERELVDRRRVLTKDQLTEALTFTKLLPGPPSFKSSPTLVIVSAGGSARPSLPPLSFCLRRWG